MWLVNFYAFIGYLVIGGIVLVIYAFIWREWTTGFAIFHGVIGGIAVLVVVAAYALRNPSMRNSTESGSRSAGDFRAEDVLLPLESSGGQAGRERVEVEDHVIRVVVLSSEKYRSRRKGSAPNYRVRVDIWNTEKWAAGIDFKNFAVIDDRGKAHFSGTWDRLTDNLREHEPLTLQPDETAEGWLYFEVADPSEHLHLEHLSEKLDAEDAAIPHEPGGGTAARRRGGASSESRPCPRGPARGSRGGRGRGRGRRGSRRGRG